MLLSHSKKVKYTQDVRKENDSSSFEGLGLTATPKCPISTYCPDNNKLQFWS